MCIGAWCQQNEHGSAPKRMRDTAKSESHSLGTDAYLGKTVELFWGEQQRD